MNPYHRGMADPIAQLRDVVATAAPAPDAMAAYLEKVRDRAYAVVDRDVEDAEGGRALRGCGLRADGRRRDRQGLRRLDRATEVIG